MEHAEMEQMMDEIERIVQCPFCLEAVKAPVAQCFNGHISCGTCKEGLTECSVCRGPFIETINRVVNELLSALPKPCPYSDKGCRLFVRSETHAQFCQYRSISCKVGVDQSCLWSGMVKEWPEHVSLHPIYKTSYNFHSTIHLYIRDFQDDWHSKGYYHCVGDEIFLFYVWKTGNDFCQTVRHLEMKRPQQDYYFQITYKRKDMVVYQSLIKSVPLKENESVESNPAVFLLSVLNDIANGNKSLDIWIEALKCDLPQNV